MRKIKILFILPKTQQGGAETQMAYLLQGLDKKKFEAYLGVLYPGNQMKEIYESIKGIKIVDFKKKNHYDILVHFRIAKFIKSNQIDIVYSFMGNHHSYIPSLISGTSTALGGIRNSNISKLSGLKKTKDILLSKLLSKLINYKLISNNYFAKEIYKQKGFDSQGILVVPNGIDFDKFSTGNKNKIINELKLQNKIVITTVGRLIESKNTEALIKNFANISKIKNNLALLIVGDGPEKNKLKTLVESLKLESKVILTGNRQDIPDILAATDIFVFPSLSEGWPNVIGEAMAAGLPVIAYPTGDVTQIIRQNFSGIITEKKMHTVTIEMLKLINNKEKRKKLGSNAKKNIKDNFSLKKMIDSYENIFIKLVENRK